jgi:hypothetical protein
MPTALIDYDRPTGLGLTDTVEITLQGVVDEDTLAARDFYPSNWLVAGCSMVATVAAIIVALRLTKICNSIREDIENEASTELQGFEKLEVAMPKSGLGANAVQHLRSLPFAFSWNRIFRAAINLNLCAMMVAALGIPGILVTILEPNNKTGLIHLEHQSFALFCFVFSVVFGPVVWILEQRIINSWIANLKMHGDK